METNLYCSEFLQKCAFWQDWGTWSECSATCGGNATQTRWRRCVNGVAGDDGCLGSGIEEIPCPQLVSDKLVKHGLKLLFNYDILDYLLT